MSDKKKMGRPIIGEAKDIPIHVRIDKTTFKKMENLCKEKKISRSELFRRLINGLD